MTSSYGSPTASPVTSSYGSPVTSAYGSPDYDAPEIFPVSTSAPTGYGGPGSDYAAPSIGIGVHSNDNLRPRKCVCLHEMSADFFLSL